MDCVAEGILSDEDASELVILVAVWVDPDAGDETAVRAANREAVRSAVEDALASDRSGRVRELLDLRDSATNAFYSGQ
jgi:formaldehyde-activating enzyme